MAKSKRSRIPYSERSDIQKIQSNWKKIRGLVNREEWSSAVVRAATATEIAANFVVREELVESRKLEKEFVDHLLKWANGLQGKFDKLILPITKGEDYHKDFKKLKVRATEINKGRNLVVHSGRFKTKPTARRIIGEARDVILGLIEPYYEGFDLEELL